MGDALLPGGLYSNPDGTFVDADGNPVEKKVAEAATKLVVHDLTVDVAPSGPAEAPAEVEPKSKK